MAERYWDRKTRRRYTYVDTDGKIIGILVQRFVDNEYAAWAYDRRIGEYTELNAALRAVETQCAAIEQEIRAAAEAAARKAAIPQGDGAHV